jgi:hypothetical protein
MAVIATFCSASATTAMAADAGAEASGLPHCDQPVASVVVDNISCSAPLCTSATNVTSSKRRSIAHYMARGAAMMAEQKDKSDTPWTMAATGERMTEILERTLGESGCFQLPDDGNAPGPANSKPLPAFRVSGDITTLRVVAESHNRIVYRTTTEDVQLTLHLALSRRGENKAFDENDFTAMESRSKSNYSHYSRAPDTPLGMAMEDAAEQATRHVAEKLIPAP